MFGMTKKQFLKKSKICLKETGPQLLLLRELMDKENQESIGVLEATRKLDYIRRNIEKIFSQYEKLNPPSKYVPLHRKILHIMIELQEAVVINSESLNAAEEGLKEKSRKKLKESQDQLDKFREEFLPITREVDLNLQRK